MSDDSIPADVTGLVGRQLLSAGSKSEHLGMVLTADDGASWALRRPGAHAFSDPVLEALDGQRIRVTGQVRSGSLFVQAWTVLPGLKSGG